MANSRYVPRWFAFDDQLFGKERAIKWKPDTNLGDLELDQRRAAQMQHNVAFAIRAALGQSARYHSMADYARAADVSERRMTDLLRGDVVMRLEDIATAERVLKIRFLSREI